MQRKWAVQPDQGGMLSREALIAALVDGATILDIAGGCLEVVVGRAPTGVPGEMVMTGAVLCWKDRTDAKPQPEVAMEVAPAPTLREVAVAEVLRDDEPLDAQAEPEAREEAEDVPLPDHIDEADGFDYSTLADEDVDEPATLAR